MNAASDRQRYTWVLLRIPRAYAVYGVCLLLLVSILVFATLRPFQVLPRIGLSPGFALIDQEGRRLTSEDLRGRIVVYNFTYIGCSAPCPQTSQLMQALQTRLPVVETYGLPVDLVTISFDAAHDTPARLHTYASTLQADLDTWHFVSGDAARLKQVIGGGFGVYYAAQTDGTFAHDPTFVLVDGSGIIRARYRIADVTGDTFQRDIELLAQEAQNSHGALRLAYEAAHLFLCYPS